MYQSYTLQMCLGAKKKKSEVISIWFLQVKHAFAEAKQQTLSWTNQKNVVHSMWSPLTLWPGSHTRAPRSTLNQKQSQWHSAWCVLLSALCVTLLRNKRRVIEVSSSLSGNIYNIPICLWLLDTYPYNPPICFVKPTSSMTIKTGKHVDANGKIYLPYLHDWKHVSIMWLQEAIACMFCSLAFPFSLHSRKIPG